MQGVKVKIPSFKIYKEHTLHFTLTIVCVLLYSLNVIQSSALCSLGLA